MGYQSMCTCWPLEQEKGEWSWRQEGMLN
jgi:hypothetical protein